MGFTPHHRFSSRPQTLGASEVPGSALTSLGGRGSSYSNFLELGQTLNAKLSQVSAVHVGRGTQHCPQNLQGRGLGSEALGARRAGCPGAGESRLPSLPPPPHDPSPCGIELEGRVVVKQWLQDHAPPWAGGDQGLARGQGTAPAPFPSPRGGRPSAWEEQFLSASGAQSFETGAAFRLGT